MLQKHLIGALALLLLFANFARAETITFWTPEEQPDRLRIQQELANQFRAKTGHNVKVVPVTEKDLGKRITAAFAAGNLPDVVYHSIQYIEPWNEAGILDADAATDVVDFLGASTFAKRPLEIAQVDGEYVAVPVDGWTQVVVYRKDLFEQKGLAPPTTFANIATAIDTLHNPPQFYGFVAATKVDENYMMQVLEHLLLANGYSPVGDDDKKALRETLQLYKKAAKASPQGELYWKQSRELYFAGKAAMIVWSPFIMDELAGLRDSAPPTINDDPTSRELAKRTGFITEVSGPSNPGGAAFADIRYMAVTTDAKTDVATEFVKFALGEGYDYILRIAPEGKFPARRGDRNDATRYVKEWASLDVGVDRKAPLADLYPKNVIDDIVAGLSTGDRWGLKEGKLNEASKIINAKFFNRIVREYIDDQLSLDETVERIEEEVAKVR